MKIRCGTCKGRHDTVAQARECDAYARYAADEVHFCESPSCLYGAGCAGYKYDSHANGFWGAGEEELERQGWAAWDDAMAASATAASRRNAFGQAT